MNAMNQIAEARASALSLRASAGACGPEQGPLKFRLTRAAESLDAVVLIAVRGIERIEELEQELRKLQAGLRTEQSIDADADIALALSEVDKRLQHVREADSQTEMSVLTMSKQIARVRSILQVLS